MFVHYKFKSAKDFCSLPVDGPLISVADLKLRIFLSKRYGKGRDFDLTVMSAQTNEEYVDDTVMIPTGTSVVIRRMPWPQGRSIVVGEPKSAENSEDVLPQSGGTSATESSSYKLPDESDSCDFEEAFSAIRNEVADQPSNQVLSRLDEDRRIKALVDTPAVDWRSQPKEVFYSEGSTGRAWGGRMACGFGNGLVGFKKPSAGYVCHRCKVPGHFIQHCPTNGDPDFDIRKMKPATGIPRSMLLTTPDGSYSLPNGVAAVLKPNESVFDKEIEGIPSVCRVSDLPPELNCPLCIRDHIITKSMCICGAKHMVADDLIPNVTLRETINSFMVISNRSSSGGSSEKTMFVHYKFKSAKDFCSLPVDGPLISVADLKLRIFLSKRYGKGRDFDLTVMSAQTNEEYVDDTVMIPTGTSVVIRRMPWPQGRSIVVGEPKSAENSEDVLPQSGGTSATESSSYKLPDESDSCDFEEAFSAIRNEVADQPSNQVLSRLDEDRRIKALVDTPAVDWRSQPKEVFYSEGSTGRAWGGRMACGFGNGLVGFKKPSAGYVCHRCKVPGHFIQHCPTNGDPDFDIRKMKPATGIPRSMLLTTPDGSYSLPNGVAAVLKPNESVFDKEIEGIPSVCRVSDLPPELNCPLCIRDHIITKSMCICGAKHMVADDLIPNVTLRETINSFMVISNRSSSGGSSDMGSAASKALSPLFSVASKSKQKASSLIIFVVFVHQIVVNVIIVD
ncbi:hypothetical protein OPV22_033040 [Ensete ventricosum]|nr:hypothetical protein OPV22_033035 [Ensete ventricosum]KAJ8460111.1 hypothetical protein OPV22_033037 [Ensete ventricosum]KAJ8460114.1 hypothetical protein OPV22_033040 [Ensete ventricosum]